jgi:hypothetical protein
MHPRLISYTLVGVGAALAVGWCVLVLPALFIAEAGRGLTFGERAMIAAPLATGSALIIIGVSRARRSYDATGAPAALTAALLVGIVAALGAVLVVVGR